MNKLIKCTKEQMKYLKQLIIFMDVTFTKCKKTSHELSLYGYVQEMIRSGEYFESDGGYYNKYFKEFSHKYGFRYKSDKTLTKL